MDLELRLLRSYVAVAQELNFTRAAERLHLAQPALSAQIRQLEERVGARLLDRTTRRVQLTPAGRTLLAHATALLDGAQEALDETRAVAAGTRGRITVGLRATAALDLVPRTLRAFQREHPGVVVSIRDIGFGDQAAGLRDGSTDIAIVWLPFRTDGLHVEPLLEEPRVVVLADSHPLASRDDLTVADLLDEPMAVAEGADPVADDFWGLVAERGGPRRAAASITGPGDLFAAISAGLVVETVPQSLAAAFATPGSGMVARSVRDLSPVTLAVCRREPAPGAAPEPLLDAFAAAAHTAAVTTPDGPALPEE